MNLTKKNWIFFAAAAALSLAVWYRFTYPQFAFIDLSVDRSQALAIAENYLKNEQQINPAEYQHAVIFTADISADRYLQKALGFAEELNFIKQHDYEFFFWKARFYKENEKEEYRIAVSAATGEVTNFSHDIKETAVRPDYGQTPARETATAFLKKRFAFNPDNYILHSELTTKHDNRTDYIFTWEKKGIFIPWSREPQTGGAKLMTGAMVSGNEILVYNKNSLDVPEEFGRFIARKKEVGRNLSVLFRIIYFSLLSASIFYVVVRRNDLVMHTTKNFCIGLTAFIFLLNLADFFNGFEGILYHYDTTSPFPSFLWRTITQFVVDTFIVTISILMPCLAGESLHYESFPEKKEGAFLHYILSSAFTRRVGQVIFLGYIAAVIMIGLQSLAFEIGERYLGVWVEYAWMTQLSASYIPFLAAFILGFVASSTEEIAFRLFSISLGKKFLRSTIAAVFFASVIWGFGHSTYMVFPMWFRGIEVTCLGLFLSYIYLRWGIIPVLVAHYLFDAFWNCSAYLLGQANPYHFWSSLIVLLLPLLWGLIAYGLNREETERPLRWRLTAHQLYNLKVLKYYLANHPPDFSQPFVKLKKEIMNHGWDLVVVEMALEEIKSTHPVNNS